MYGLSPVATSSKVLEYQEKLGFFQPSTDLEQMTGLIPSTFQVVFILGIMALVSFLLIDRLYKQRGE